MDGHVEVVGVGVSLWRRLVALGPDDGAEVLVAAGEEAAVRDAGRRRGPEGIRAVGHHVEIGLERFMKIALISL